MEIKEVLNILRSPQNIVEYRLYFTRKRGKKEYISYSPLIEPDVAEKIKDIIIDALEKQENLPVVNFSPIGCYDEMLEQCEVSEIGNFSAVIESLCEEKLERENIESKDINKLNFYCLSVNYIVDEVEKNIKFFRRLTKLKKLSSSGIFGQIKNNRFKKIEAEMLGIDGDVDIIVQDSFVIILNHISLERIFSISDQYTEKAMEAIEKVGNAGRIENFEQFKEDCQNDRRITRILTKLLSEEEKLEHCFENFENVKKAIQIFELGIETPERDGKEVLLYERKEQLMDMVRLIRDSYYTSIVGEVPGVDNSI